MRLLFLAAYVANLILVGALLRRPPARMLAGHSSATPVMILAALYTLLLVAILLAPRLLRRCPARWIGIPHPEYWLQAANRAETERKIQARLLSFGTVAFLILLAAGLLVLRFQQAPRSQPEWWGLRGLAIFFLAYSVYWYVAFLRDFRISAEARVSARVTQS
jgi:hypothetical protein